MKQLVSLRMMYVKFDLEILYVCPVTYAKAYDFICIGMCVPWWRWEWEKHMFMMFNRTTRHLP